MEMSGQLYGPVALAPGKNPQYSLDRGWVGLRVDLSCINLA